MRPFQSAHIPKPELDFTSMEFLARKNLDLEIGAGQGWHAIQYATRHSSRNLLAIERTHNKYEKFRTRLEHHSARPNLLALHADATSIITHYIKPNSLENVFLLYPNPYPKAKQANLRWHNQPFFALLRKCMAPGGNLILATNLPWYASEAENTFKAEWGLELTNKYSIPQSAPPRTHFERKYLERGEPCTNLCFRLPSALPLG